MSSAKKLIKIQTLFIFCISLASLVMVFCVWDSIKPNNNDDIKYGKKYNINEFLIAFPDYKLYIDGNYISSTISTRSKEIITSARGVVTLKKICEVTEEKYQVYIKETDKLYQLCNGLYVKVNSPYFNQGDYYFFYVKNSFMLNNNIDKTVEKLEKEGKKSESPTYTGLRKERYKVAEVLRKEASNLDAKVVTFHASGKKDSKGRKLKVVGHIECSNDEKDRGYRVVWINGHLQELGCYDENTKELAEKLNREKLGIEPINEKTQKRRSKTMFGLSLLQLIGVIVIAFVIAKTAHYINKKSTIKFVKKRFLNYLERRKRVKAVIKKAKKDLKQEWDNTEV